jgi:hypothetical protein
MNYIGPLGSPFAASGITVVQARRYLTSFCVVGLLFTSGAASAQDRATLILRSGEKVSGLLVDLGGGGYTVQTAGSERLVPPNDVSVIDFSGSDMGEADWARFKGTPQVLLRSGESFDGSLYDISGTTPLHLTIKTSDGQREVASSDVTRIVISRPEIAVGTSGRARAGPGVAAIVR